MIAARRAARDDRDDATKDAVVGGIDGILISFTAPYVQYRPEDFFAPDAAHRRYSDEDSLHDEVHEEHRRIATNHEPLAFLLASRDIVARTRTGNG